MTPYGEVELKICTSAGETYIYPEYDSIRGLVQETGRSYQEIYQKAVDILPGDTPEVLQKRVMEQAEWKIMPQAINDIANGKIKVVDNKVIYQ